MLNQSEVDIHHEENYLRSGSIDHRWAYLATFGKQSLAEDSLGMAVLYESANLIEVTANAESHVLSLKPENGKLTYYFLGAWEQEPDGIQTEEAFKEYLEQTIAELNSPIKLEL